MASGEIDSPSESTVAPNFASHGKVDSLAVDSVFGRYRRRHSLENPGIAFIEAACVRLNR